MMNNKIIIIFVLLLKFSFIKSFYIILDKIFKKIIIQNPYCYNINNKIEPYRGVITNIKQVIKDNKTDINKNLTKYERYPCVYLPNDESLFKYIDFFPDTTLFFTTFSIDHSKIKKNICYIKVEDWSYYNHYYIIIAENNFGYVVLPLIFCIFYLSGIFVNRRDKSIERRRLMFYRQIYFYKFAHNIPLYSCLIVISTVTIYYFLLSYIVYSLYKAYFVINLIILLEGYSTIHFNDCKKIIKKYILVFFLFDSLTSIFSEYIVYFFPSIDNFYLFHLKSIIEHSAFLLVIFIFFKTKYIHLYKQYQLEKRLGTILSVSYKLKTVIYLKIMIFSIIYCSVFIVLPFIEKLLLKIDNVVESFYLNYFISICLEAFSSIAISVILSPHDLTLFFFLPIIFDYNRFKFQLKIKEENKEELNISNINCELLKNEYEGKRYPLIFINPYGKTNNVFGDLHVGLIKKKKKAN